MKHWPLKSLSLVSLVGIAALSGCGGSMSNSSPTPPTNNIVAPMQQAVSPDACGKNVKEAIKPAGGIFTIPTCGGTTGNITYASNNAPAKSTVTLQASTSNPAPSNCGSPTGETVVAYLLATGNSTASSITYGTTTKKSYLKNPAFPTTVTFSLYSYVFGVLQPGYPISVGKPSKKGTLTFKSPLNGQTVPSGITICFELATP